MSPNETALNTNWSFLDHLSEGILLLQEDSTLVFINEAARQQLQLFGYLNNLRELYEQVASDDKWPRWERLIQNVPTQAQLATHTGEIDIQAKHLPWHNDENLIMLILNPAAHYDDLLDQNSSREALYQHIGNLRRENEQLQRHLSQIERLEILAQASHDIAQGMDEASILTSLGQYICQVVSATGYTVYQWVSVGHTLRILLNQQYPANIASPIGDSPSAIYEIDAQHMLNQLTDRQTLLMTQISATNQGYLLGKIAWQPTATVTLNVILIPVFGGTEPFGFIAVGIPPHQAELDQNSFQLLSTLTNQTVTALDKISLVNSLRALNDELDQRVIRRTTALGAERDRFELLLRITTELSSTLDQEHILNRALELVNEVAEATQGIIMLIDEEGNIGQKGEFIFRAAFGMSRFLGHMGQPTGLMRGQGLAGWVVANRQAVIVPDTAQDPRWVMRTESSEHRSALAVPLEFSGEGIGVLMLFHNKTHAFSPQQLKLLEAAATQVSSAIYNAHLYTLIRNQAEKLGRLLREEQVGNAKMQAILESIADGVLVADRHGEIILANAALNTILGVTREKWIGRNVRELSGIYGKSGHAWLGTIETWAINPRYIAGETFLEEQMTIEDDGRIVSVHLAPVFAGRQFFGTVSIFRDRTKEVEVDRMKSDFVSTVSHELRTPLTSIKGYTDLILMGATGVLSEAQERYLQVIKSNADRLQDLVNDLLDISRLEAGRARLELKPISLAGLIDEIVHGHLQGRIQHEGKAMAAVISTTAVLPPIQGDETRLTQILTNLIDNAFNYTPEGGQISVKSWVEGGQVHISISDTGYGIAPHQLDKIFDRFYRSDDARIQKVSGTGLGLPIVQHLVAMHGGSLQVVSELGQGSTFTVTLPIPPES